MTDPQATDSRPPTPGSPMVIIDSEGNTAAASPADGAASSTISSPDKVMRIGTMVKQLLDEVRAAPLDDRSRERLRDIHAQSITELSEGLSPDLSDELRRLALPLAETEIPSDAELRIAQAQLVGWLEGVFHGIQAAMVSQQLAARMQVEQQQGHGRQLPAGRPDLAGGGQYL